MSHKMTRPVMPQKNSVRENKNRVMLTGVFETLVKEVKSENFKLKITLF